MAHEQCAPTCICDMTNPLHANRVIKIPSSSLKRQMMIRILR